MKLKTITINTKSIDEERRIIRGVIASTGGEDRHGDSVNPKGWDLRNYKKNPVIMYGHDYSALPVGKAVKIYNDDNALYVDIKFARHQFAEEVFNLYKDGYLNAVSVGFLVKEFGKEKDPYTIMQQELLEISCVPVPANAEALVTRGFSQEDIDEKIAKLQKLYEEETKKEKDTKSEKDSTESKTEVANEKETDKEETITEEVKAYIEKVKRLEIEVERLKELVERNNTDEEEEILKELHKELKTRDKEIGLLLREWKNSLTNKGGE